MHKSACRGLASSKQSSSPAVAARSSGSHAKRSWRLRLAAGGACAPLWEAAAPGPAGPLARSACCRGASSGCCETRASFQAAIRVLQVLKHMLHRHVHLASRATF